MPAHVRAAVRHAERRTVVNDVYADILAVPHLHTICVVIAIAVELLDLGTRIADTDAAERHILIRDFRRAEGGGEKDECEDGGAEQ